MTATTAAAIKETGPATDLPPGSGKSDIPLGESRR